VYMFRLLGTKKLLYCMWKSNEACSYVKLLFEGLRCLIQLRKSRVLVLSTVYMFRLLGINKDIIVFEYGGPMKLDILRTCTKKVKGFYYACKMRLKS
jgi:hypothetical protein